MIIINLNYEQGKGKVVTKEVTQILRAWPRMRVDNWEKKKVRENEKANMTIYIERLISLGS